MCAAMGDGGVAGTHVAEKGTEDRGMYFYGEHAETPAILLQIGGGAHLCDWCNPGLQLPTPLSFCMHWVFLPTPHRDASRVKDG